MMPSSKSRITSYNVCYTKLLRIGAAHHVCDLLLGIIDNHGKLVGDQAVRPPDDEVANLPVKLLLQGTLQTVDQSDAALCSANPQGAGAAPGRQAVTAGTRVA